MSQISERGARTESELRAAIDERRARISVIGCGYVGLPLALGFADAGFCVTALDVDKKKVESLLAGTSYIGDISDAEIAKHVKAGRLRATTDPASLAEADVIFVAVPTPFDRAKQPDLRFVVAAAEDLSRHLRKGQLIILESTTFPGTTDEVLRPTLERSGLRGGVDFYLAFSPERIDPGNKQFTIANTPKVVGGIDPVSTSLAVHALQQVVAKDKVHAVSSPRVAELTKLLENTFRAVNIALVNELAMLCDRMGINVWEVITAASTKPYGYVPFYPGPGVGGHCIPVDPYYLSWKAREFDFHTKFIELAAETNLEMPFFTASRVRRLLDRARRPLPGARILALGVAFKRDIEDARNSAAIRVMEILRNDGATLDYHDPFVPEISLSSGLFTHDHDVVLRSVDLTPERLRSTDCVVILVGHSRVDYDLVLEHAPVVFDAVNAGAGRPAKALVERL